VSFTNKRRSSSDGNTTIPPNSLFFKDSQRSILDGVPDKYPFPPPIGSSFDYKEVPIEIPAAVDYSKHNGVGGSMSGMICNVSGIDTSPEAREVFVWCRDKATGTNLLVLTGRVVGSGGGYVPPGVFKGQFRFTFILAGQYSTKDIQVTADNNGKKILPDVTVETPCSAAVGLQSGVAVTVSQLTVCANGPSRSANGGQIIVIRSTESET
jgi:hypothetical protein